MCPKLKIKHNNFREMNSISNTHPLIVIKGRKIHNSKRKMHLHSKIKRKEADFRERDFHHPKYSAITSVGDFRYSEGGAYNINYYIHSNFKHLFRKGKPPKRYKLGKGGSKAHFNYTDLVTEFIYNES